MSDRPDQQAETNLTGDVQGPVFSGAFAGPVTIVLNGSPQLHTSTWKHVNWAAAMQRYQQELVRQYGSMQLFGMTRPVPLAAIFTDAYLLDKPNAWRRHNIEELHALGLVDYDQQPWTERKPGIELLRSEQRLFIFGKPGAGKTTFLKYLTDQAIHGGLSAVPIVVSLKQWSDAGGDLIAFMEQQFAICGFPRARAFIDATLGAGQALVLFDGLDEINLEANARSITAAIRDFAQQYGQCQIVITCRTAATDYTFEGFRYCELADFSIAQSAAFAANWFHSQPAKLLAFQKALAAAENKGLRELARTPLLLTLLCLTFDQTGQFPLRRAELYEQAIDALLKKWDASRDIKRDTLYKQLSLGHKRQLLAELAAQSFQDGRLYLRRETLSNSIAAYLQRVPGMPADADGDLVLQAIEAQHGLLVERATEIYSFSHMTFQEYFTARYIVSKPHHSQFEALVSHAYDPQWRELLLLTASMLECESAMLLFRTWADQLKRMASTPLLRMLITSITQWREPQYGDEYQDRLVLLVLTLGRSSFLASALARASTSALAVDLAIASTLDLLLTLACYSVATLANALADDPDRASIYAYASARDLANGIASTIDLNRALDGELDSELVRARDLASDLASALDGELVRASALANELTDALNQALVVFVTTTLTQRLHDYQTGPTSLMRQCIWWYTLRWAIETTAMIDDIQAGSRLYIQIKESLQQLVTAAIDQTLAQMLLRALPLKSSPEKADWQAFVERTHELLRTHKNIPDLRNLPAQEVELLDQYLISTVQLVACLKLATITDRELILNELLVVPEE